MKKLLLYSCLIYCISCADDPNDIPAIFTIDDVSLETSDLEGSNSDNIKDVWVFLGGEDVGVFELPAKIPIIDNAEGLVQISPGVRNNGINSSPIIYPFYDSKLLDLDLSKGRTETLDLDYGYVPNAKFALIEDFETTNIFTFEVDGDENSEMVISSDEVFEGEGSGHIHLDEDAPFAEVATEINFFDLPSNGQAVFMEMDYKNSVELNVGLIGFLGNTSTPSFYKLVLKEQEDWNKVYIDFTFDIVDSGLESYKILFGAAINPGDDPADVYFDNIKLIHF